MGGEILENHGSGDRFHAVGAAGPGLALSHQGQQLRMSIQYAEQLQKSHGGHCLARFITGEGIHATAENFRRFFLIQTQLLPDAANKFGVHSRRIDLFKVSTANNSYCPRTTRTPEQGEREALMGNVARIGSHARAGRLENPTRMILPDKKFPDYVLFSANFKSL